MPGQDNSCGATLLDDKIVRLARTYIRRLLITESHTPSHILRKLRFRSPSEVHSIQSCPAVIAPSTALLERRFCTYLPFLIGLMVLYNKLPLLSILI